MAGVAPATDYPQGGIAMTSGGEGIFTDTAGEPIRIWIDYRIKACRTIIKQLQVSYPKDEQGYGELLTHVSE
jgi:hypothetical protein